MSNDNEKDNGPSVTGVFTEEQMRELLDNASPELKELMLKTLNHHTKEYERHMREWAHVMLPEKNHCSHRAHRVVPENCNDWRAIDNAMYNIASFHYKKLGEYAQALVRATTYQNQHSGALLDEGFHQLMSEVSSLEVAVRTGALLLSCHFQLLTESERDDKPAMADLHRDRILSMVEQVAAGIAKHSQLNSTEDAVDMLRAVGSVKPSCVH